MTARLALFRRTTLCSMYFLCASGLYAQETAATLVGSVTDSSGAVVTDVLVRSYQSRHERFAGVENRQFG